MHSQHEVGSYLGYLLKFTLETKAKFLESQVVFGQLTATLSTSFVLEERAEMRTIHSKAESGNSNLFQDTSGNMEDSIQDLEYDSDSF